MLAQQQSNTRCITFLRKAYSKSVYPAYPFFRVPQLFLQLASPRVGFPAQPLLGRQGGRQPLHCAGLRKQRAKQ